MRRQTTGERGRFLRLMVAVMLVIPALVLVPATFSTAAPSKADLDAAKSKLDALNQELSLLVEQYNQARVRLQEIKDRRAEVLGVKQDADEEASAAIRALTQRAGAAYMDAGSQLDVILGSGSFSELSDRLEFLDRLQADDVALAASAESAGQRAEWAAAELEKAEQEQAQVVVSLERKQLEIEDAVKGQRALVDKIGEDIQQAQERRQAAAEAAAEAAASSSDPSPTGGTGGGDSYNAPPASGKGQIALSAAMSVIGTEYEWGGASPNGFDCSGLTMWAWSQAGVSLPHSSSAQYATTPRVERSDLQPGDLLFFYSPISHVAMYAGGNSMIDASHPGASGAVQVQSIYWEDYVGAGRPG
jgi:peptidoglycan DL-endopeptidase CwlO